MVFKVFLDDVIGDIASTPGTVADSPEVFAPVAFLEFGEFLLDKSGGSAFESLHEFTDGESGWVCYVHMDVVFAYYPFEDSDVFGVTDLHDKGATAVLDISLEDWVAVFSDPDEMDGHTRDSVSVVSVMVRHESIIPSTESLALKCIV